MVPRLRTWITDEERGFLGRGIAAVLLGFGALGVVWTSPWSPEAEIRPAGWLGLGLREHAVASWRSLGEGRGPNSVRAAALQRAAWLAAVDLDDATEAAALFEALAQAAPSAAEKARAWEALGALLEAGRQEPQWQGDASVRAANAWEAAAAADPDSAAAGDRWLRAGLAWDRAGQRERAVPALQHAADHAPAAVSAWLALGDLHLTEDAEAAKSAYLEAIEAGARDGDLNLARLGVATALLRLNRADEAINWLDEAIVVGEGDDALKRRREALRLPVPP